MELNALPDDELMLVLACLAPADLLQCRTVCRRWHTLAMDPLVWRNQTLVWESFNPGAVARSILRCDPCLGLLDIDLSDLEVTPASDKSLLLSTACAVRDLKCDLDGSPSSVHFFLQILERQVFLGRLKSVHLNVFYYDDSSELGTLLQQVIQTGGLQSLHVWVLDDHENPPLFQRPRSHIRKATVPSSLRRLHWEYEHTGTLDPCLLLLLQRHADTLEAVGIWTVDPRAAALLSSMPRLRKLECLLMENMTGLVLPPSLKSLDLDLCVRLDEGVPARVPGLKAFLHSAVAQLEDLVFRFGRGSWADDPDVVDLVRCLGSAGSTSAALRSLSFVSGSWPEREAPLILSPLTSILHRLPHLTHLDIGCVPTVHFLEALDGTVLQELSLLTVSLDLLRSCEHKWGHSALVKRVMGAYPRLHIGVQNLRFTEGCECRYCNMACHSLPPKGSCIMFSHPQSSSCKVSHRLAGGPCAELVFHLV